MKAITLRTEPKEWATKPLIKQVIEVSPNRALTIDEIRKRTRVLDKLDELAPDATALILEDADHATVVGALRDFPFNVANKHLLRVIDDIFEAETP